MKIRPVWHPLSAKKRPGRLSDELHSNWEVTAGVLPGYDGLLRVRIQYREERAVTLVVNDRGDVVSRHEEELEN